MTDLGLPRAAVYGGGGSAPFGGPPTVDGRIFRQAGAAWRWKGVSAFRLLDRFANGQDVTPFLACFAGKGFNVLRVWREVDWPRPFGWSAPTWDRTVAFLALCRSFGFHVELTLVTDDRPERLGPAQDLLRVIPWNTVDNLLLEAANEPRTNGKQTDTAALRTGLQASGCLFASGDYEDSARAFGSYLVCHTGRDYEWPRRAHDLLEFFSGGGPNRPSDPAHRCPIVGDEPIRPDQATPMPGDPTRSPSGVSLGDFYAYAATCSLLGAGATFHCESGKQATLPEPYEIEAADAFARGLAVFPADAANGAYGRPVERSLRTYTVGPYMVRIRPATREAPLPGYTALDDWGICWRQA